MHRTLITILCALACLTAASAARGVETPLQQARDEVGEPPPTPTTWPLPNGLLRVSPADLLGTGQPVRITFAVRLDAPAPGGALAVVLPAAFHVKRSSGIRATRPPRAGRGDVIERDGRTVVVPFGDRELEYEFSLDQVGLPARRYALPLRWRDSPGGAFRPAGEAELTVYPAARESAPDPAEQWRSLAARGAVNASTDPASQSETFVTVDPRDPRRVLVAANGPEEIDAFLDTGSGFQPIAMPPAVDVPGTASVELAGGTCDPILAAEPAGALWFGGLTECRDPRERSARIALARVDPSTNTVTGGVGLPTRPGSLARDKPMLDFDPVRNRVYATWVEVTGSTTTEVVLTWCDVSAAACHTNADAWQTPVAVTHVPATHIYPDVATGADGDVHVVWWDYSATNAIQGATCADPCNGSFGAASTVALLDRTGGVPLPFACPILVAPGGRVGAVPSVDVQRSTDRVFVSWGDLRPESGTSRCEFDTSHGGSPPLASHRSWDAFVASRVGALPGGARPSAEVGTPLIVDGDESVAANSDEIFPWLTVDDATGDVWTALYSTGHDPTRRTAHFHGVSVLPDGEGHLVGPANRVSVAASSHAGEPCCHLGNDFGDYEGVAAAQGQVIPAWSDNSTGVEDAFVFRGQLQTVGFDIENTGVAELAGADGDGLLEPGERALVTVRVRNTGTRSASGPAGPLLEGTPRVDGAGMSVKPQRVTFPVLAPGASGTASDPLELALASGFDCTQPAPLRLSVSAAEGAETVTVPLPVGCPGPSAPPPPPPTPAPFVVGLLDLEIPSDQRVRTVRARGLRTDVLCAETCRVVFRVSIDSRAARRLKTRLRTLARASLLVAGGDIKVVRLRLSLEARRALARARTLNVAVHASVAGASPGQMASMTRRTTLVR